jgi:carboxyl-terminal processing protease
VRENDSLVKLVKPMDIQPVAADYNTYFKKAYKAKGERYQQWLKSIQADVYIYETANIIEDIFEEEHTNTVKK